MQPMGYRRMDRPTTEHRIDTDVDATSVVRGRILPQRCKRRIDGIGQRTCMLRDPIRGTDEELA